MMMRSSTVEITVEGYGTMQGYLDRIVKIPGPWLPETQDESLWTAHVFVSGEGRKSGIFTVPYKSLKLIKAA